VNVGSYYAGKFAEHGDSPQGVDWSNLRDMQKRFEALEAASRATMGYDRELTDLILLDYGSGLAHLYEWLKKRGFKGSYVAYDIATPLLMASERKFGRHENFRSVETLAAAKDADIVWASGVFNIKGSVADSYWLRVFVEPCFSEIVKLDPRVVALNFLRNDTNYPRKKPELFHTSPVEIRESIRQVLARLNVTRRMTMDFVEDYGLNEFTVALTFPEA
jgi:hypothetical protein